MQSHRIRAGLIVVAMLLAPGLAGAQVPDGQAAATQQQARQQRRERIRTRLQQRFEARFHQMDANHDGVISRDEWNRNPRAFDWIDANSDGVLTQGELKAGIARAVRRHLRRG